MQVSWNILYGFPGEKKEHYDKTSRTVTLISHLHPPMSVLRIILQRFSPYHFDAERLGIRNVRPASLYYHIYPESTVDLNNLAFYFDHSLDSQYEKPENYIGPVMALVTRWQEAFRKKKIHFYYRHGPGFLEIKDNRPLERQRDRPIEKNSLEGNSSGRLPLLRFDPRFQIRPRVRKRKGESRLFSGRAEGDARWNDQGRPDDEGE
jgi:hypothetical protein